MADVQYIDVQALAPFVMDNILTANNAFATLALRTDPQEFKSIQMKFPIQLVKPTTGGSFSGLDQFSVGQTDTNQALVFDPKFYYQSIALADTDIAKNRTDPNAAVDLTTTKIEEGSNALVDSVGDLFYLDGTGNSGKDFLGLKAIADDGTVASTYGGLSRTTYTTLKASRTATGGALSALSTISTAVNAATKGNETPNVHLTTPSIWNTLESLLPLTQFTTVQQVGYEKMTSLGNYVAGEGGLAADAGLTTIRYRGVPVVKDDKCTSTYWYGLNMKRLKWYGMQMKGDNYHAMTFGGNKNIQGIYQGIKSVDGSSIGLCMTDMKVPVDQAGRIGQIILGGNELSEAPNRQFVLIFA